MALAVSLAAAWRLPGRTVARVVIGLMLWLGYVGILSGSGVVADTVDQFHMGGLAATIAFAGRVGIMPRTAVLDAGRLERKPLLDDHVYDPQARQPEPDRSLACRCESPGQRTRSSIVPEIACHRH